MNQEPAEIFSPGEFLEEELQARQWSHQDLAQRLGQPQTLVSSIISGTQSITPNIAKGLGQVMGTSPQLWLNLEQQFQWKTTEQVCQAREIF